MKNPGRVYEFHLKMDTEMTESLRHLPLLEKTGNLSRLIVHVLGILRPVMEKKHLNGEQKLSEYLYIHEDKSVKRKSVHVYLPDYLYRELKALHHDLNFYSMAQLLRLFLRLFLDLWDLYGEKLQARLLRVLELWNAQRLKRKKQKISVRQLSQFINQKSEMSRYIALYSNTSEPLGFYRL